MLNNLMKVRMLICTRNFFYILLQYVQYTYM